MTNENNIIGENIKRLKALLNENDEYSDTPESLDAIPYTSNDDMLAKMTNEAKTIFGADFTKSKTPLLYFPKDGDVTLTGEINSLNNAKFQFKLNTSSESGIILWVDSLPITDNVVTILNKMNGAGKNWKKELNEIGRKDLKPMSARDNDDTMGQGDEVPSSNFQNGDDLD